MRRLPAGAHGIPPDVVARNQRERLIAAAAEACAESGYAETTVADLSHRAGVSTATFYKRFADKGECVLEAHRELLERLLEAVDRACGAEQDRRARLRAGTRTVLSLLAADPPTARLLTVEILGLGPVGVARNDAAIEAFAGRVRAVRDPGLPPPSPDADWALVAGISMLLGKLVVTGRASSLPGLEDELVAQMLSVD